MAKLNWTEVNDFNDFNDNNGFIVIFKHSYRCIISRIVLKKFEFESDNSITNIKYFLIDVLKNREISNKIASVFNIDHESPQLIIIKNGELVHNSSHSDISFSDVIHRVD
ncbi:bacillithiol system redox-active protein YtxJ [Flavobacteriaceae bacterium]|nr:bacillithiol system redox-active protein YtxJ [Flavobacteriaceae bacterium]